MTNGKLNGARLAILSNRLEGIARKMANTLYRTGRSGVLNRARDFSCCIVTADCELLAAAESLPIHVLAGPDQMAEAMKQFHPQLRRGDAFLHNSPYHGCSHPADHTILVPVIDDAGTHHFTVIAKAHQADIGNSVPTTYHGSAKDVYEEGALIFPCVQVERDYQTISDVVRMCEMRIRVPEQWKGDFLAMLGSARIGENELLELGVEFGWDYLHAFAQQWFDYSERRMVEAIAKVPAGSVVSTSTHDHFPGTPENGVTISAKITTDPARGLVTIDLTDNPDALPCGLNVSEACTRTSSLIGVFNSLDHSVPKNSGSFRRVNIKLREGAVVGIPRHPTSCSVATTNLADRIANAIQTGFSQIQDGIGMAEVGAVIPPADAVVSGVDPRNGEAFVNQLFLGATGGGASPAADCWLTYCHVGNGGLCYLDSIELDELYQPIHVQSRYLLTDTEGAGRFRGAPSLFVEFGPLDCCIEIGYVSDGCTNAAKGVLGGLAGRPAEQYKRTRAGTLEPLEACAQLVLEKGESVVSISCGGGGYGPPQERDPMKVSHDARERWISRERAREIYRVVLTENFDVDVAKTAELRGN